MVLLFLSRRRAALAAATAAILTVVTACTGSGLVTTAAKIGPAADQPPASFLTVATSPAKFLGVNRIARYPVETLQLRSVRHGRLIRTLLRTLGGLGSLEAVPAGDGKVLAAADFGCRSKLFLVNPATGRSRLIRVVPESVQDIAVSPDGRRLAYITGVPSQRQPCAPARQLRHPVNVKTVEELPDTPAYDVVAVISLATGATVRARIPHGADPTWSPDGRDVAVTDLWANQAYVLSAARLKVLTRHKFLPPHGCGYTATGWTRTGLTVAVQCDIERPRSLPSLGFLPLTWRAKTRMLPLPRCAAGTSVSFAEPAALVGVGLGYGGGKPCGLPKAGGYAVAAFLVRGDRLTRAATFPQQYGVFTVAGW